MLAQVDWSKWATPEGALAILAILTTLLGFLTTFLNIIGKKEAAKKVEAARGEVEELKTTVQEHKDQIAQAGKVLVGVVQGVQQFRVDNPDHAFELRDTIQKAAQAIDIEHAVQPVVKAITEGKGSIAEALTTVPPQP